MCWRRIFGEFPFIAALVEVFISPSPAPPMR